MVPRVSALKAVITEMGWSHPDISIEDLLDLIKGFVDILVLASGYQSSGFPAIWDVDNIKKAVKWGIFFEHVLKSLRSYGNYEESVKELDAALSNLTSDPSFPLGLRDMSSATLCNARELVLKHFLQSHPVNDKHFVAFLRAVVEMDIAELSETSDDSSSAYIDRLDLQMKSLDLAAKNLLPVNDAVSFNCSEHGDQNFDSPLKSGGENDESSCADNSFFVVKEILCRQAIISDMHSVEKGLNGLSDAIRRSDLLGSEDIKRSTDGVSSDGDQMFTELCQFSHWRSRCLSYLLDKRTVKLLSGARMILEAPKEQWIRVFDGLKSSSDPCYENLLEIVEILLLGLISSKWNYLIQQLIALPCDFVSISKKFSELHELVSRKFSFQGNSPALPSNKENDILSYLTSLLNSEPHKLWKLPSVLVAAALPLWSILLRMHLKEIENYYNEACSSIRCHACCQHGNGLHGCKVAEIIRSLYALHMRCSAGGA